MMLLRKFSDRARKVEPALLRDSIADRAWTTGGKPLQLRNAGALDHRRPFADVALEARLQFLGGAGLGFDPEVGVFLLHVGARPDLVAGLVQQAEDRRRRWGRSKEPG